MPDRVLRIVIAGDAKGGLRAFAQTDAAAKSTAKTLDGTAAKTSKLGATLAGLGKKAALTGLAAVGIAGFESVKGVMALQKQMEMLRTQAGATQGQVGTMTTAVEKLAPQVGTGPQSLAEGLYHVVSSLNKTIPATQRVSTEMKVLKIAAEGAKIGNANLVDVTNALDAAIVSGIKGVQNYQQAMGSLNSIVGAGDMKMQDLADALGTGVLASAKIAGLSIKQLGGALATLGDNNIRGADAGTLLKSTIRVMADSSAAGMKVLSQIGIGQGQLADDMRKGGLIKAFEDLKQHMTDAGLTSTQEGLLLTRAFGGRQATGVQILLTQMDRLKATTKQVGAGANSFASDWAAAQKTLSYVWDSIKAGVQAYVDELGGKLLPTLTSAGTWLLKNQRTVKDVGVALAITTGLFAAFKAALLAGRAVMATMAFLTEGWKDAFWALDAAMDANPVGLIIIGVAALAAGFIYAYKHSARFREAIKELGPVARIAFEPIILLINGTILGINLVIKAVNLLIKAYDALPSFMRPTSKLGTIGFSVPMLGGNLYGGSLGLGALQGAKSPASNRQNSLPATTGQASGGLGLVPIDIHVHTRIGDRVASETKTRYDLNLAARR